MLLPSPTEAEMGLRSLKRKGAMPSKAAAKHVKRGTAQLREVPLGQGEKIAVGDDVLVKSGSKQPDFLAKVLSITQVTNSRTDVRVQWYYRPEDTVGGAKKFHGEAEVFKSDHFDVIELASVNSPCRVHLLKDYQELTVVGDKDYFSRFQYKPATNLFKPDRVPVYCKCEMPYNPDKVMIMCEECTEWYHPECLGFTDEWAEELEHFTCYACREQAGNRDEALQSRSAAKGKAAARKT